jgi:hypothetical protein
LFAFVVIVALLKQMHHFIKSKFLNATRMTSDLLSKAIKQAALLPIEIQDELAEQLLRDIQSELRWQETLDLPQPKLDMLAEKALQASREGNTLKIGLDEL